MARKTSNFDALVYLASKLPWWVSALLAVVSGIWLHSVAVAPIPPVVDARHFDTVLTAGVFHGLATVGQFFVPLIFIAGAIASIVGRRKRRTLLDSTAASGGNALLALSWQDFELLVGEALRRRGFSVQETGGAGPDGGVDLVARKEGERYLVQCKQWRALQVGVPVVRELYGAMAAEGAVGGFVVTSGTFTQQAREFAAGRNLQLVDGALLKQWMAELKKPGPQPTVDLSANAEAPKVEPVIDVPPQAARPAAKESAPEPQVLPKAPACPHCRKTMVLRVARSGANAGGNFWGCADYPKCRGMRRFAPPMPVK